jgi:hypothetical protein
MIFSGWSGFSIGWIVSNVDGHVNPVENLAHPVLIAAAKYRLFCFSLFKRPYPDFAESTTSSPEQRVPQQSRYR